MLLRTYSVIGDSLANSPLVLDISIVLLSTLVKKNIYLLSPRHLFVRCLLQSTYYVPDTVLGAEAK